MAMPVIVAGLGALLGASRRPAIWLAGRRLALRSVNFSRPAAIVGALVFIAGGSFAIYARLAVPGENQGLDAPFVAYQVNWRDLQPGDIELAMGATKSMAVVPLTGTDTTTPKAHFTYCDQVNRWVRPPMAPCADDDRLSPAFTDYFTRTSGGKAALGQLLRLGLRTDEIERSYRWCLLPPVVIAIQIGLVGALLFSDLGTDLGLTVLNVGPIALVAEAAGALSLSIFAVVFVIQRRISNLDEQR